MSNDTIWTGWAGKAALAAATALAGLGAAGCEATFHPAPLTYTFEPAPVVRAEVVPPDIWSYPRVYYDGAWAYLVDGRWYTLTPSGWMIYRREPVELYRQRTTLGQRRFYRAPTPEPPERRPPPQPYPPYPAYPEPPRWRQ